MASFVPCCCDRGKSVMGKIVFCSSTGGAEVEFVLCLVTIGGGASAIVSFCSLNIC